MILNIAVDSPISSSFSNQGMVVKVNRPMLRKPNPAYSFGNEN